MTRHHGPISGVAAYGDQYVITAGYDNQVILWDHRTRRPLARSWHDHLSNQVAFSPDGRYAVTSSSDYTARLWTVPDLRLRAVFAEHDDDVEMAVFHPRQPWVATASRDHRVRVYDFSGTLLATMTGHRADVISVDWAHDRDELVSSSDDGTIKRWSFPSGDLIDDIDTAGVETDTVAISSAGTVFAGTDEGRIIVVRDGDRSSFPAHDAGIKRLVLDDARALLVSLSYDRTMRLWDVSAQRPAPLGTTELPPDVWPRSCAFAGDRELVFATFGSTYRVYDHRSAVWDRRPIEPTEGVNAVLATPGGVLSVGDAGAVRRDGHEVARTHSLCNFLAAAPGLVLTGGQLGTVFDALTGRPLHQHRSPLNCGARFDRDGTAHVVVGTYTGEGLVFRTPGDGTCEPVDRLPLHTNAVKGVAAGGDWIFSVGADASATWYRVSTGTVEATRPDAHDKIANGCAALGDGWFASVSRDLKLRIWDPDRTAEVISTPHTHSVKCVAASPDGRFIVTASYRGTVAVYDRAARAWGPLQRPTTAGISSLCHAPATGGFIAGSYDGRLYPVDPGDAA